MHKALIITGPGFEDSEFIYPYYRVQEEGFEVEVLTSNNKEVFGKHGIKATPTISSNELEKHNFDLIIIPGGHEAPDRVRQVKEILVFLEKENRKKKIIASICHGPWVLISAKIVKGREMTSYKACKDDLINAGAIYSDLPVVVDNNIITAQHFRDNPQWMKMTLEKFHNK